MSIRAIRKTAAEAVVQIRALILDFSAEIRCVAAFYPTTGDHCFKGDGAQDRLWRPQIATSMTMAAVAART
jgi:hypothetical protein